MTLKERILTKDISLDNYRGKWRNLLFRKDGTSELGTNLWASQEEALKANRNSIYENLVLKKYKGFNTLGRPIINEDYSHAIQIQVGE